MAEMTSDIRILATELVKRVNDETRRTRLLEQKIDRFEAELTNLESAIDIRNEENKLALQNIADTLKNISDRMLVMENAIGRIEKELGKKATKSELKKIDTYMDLMSPITSKYVTRAELDRAIEEKNKKKF